MNLTQFLLDNPVDNVEGEVIISERFKDAEGNILKFKIKPMTGGQYSQYQKISLTMKKKSAEFDTKKFNELLCINHTINPNFRDSNTLSQAGCATPEQFLNKYLLAGEISELSEQIRKISGFNENLEDLVEEAKN